MPEDPARFPIATMCISVSCLGLVLGLIVFATLFSDQSSRLADDILLTLKIMVSGMILAMGGLLVGGILIAGDRAYGVVAARLSAWLVLGLRCVDLFLAVKLDILSTPSGIAGIIGGVVFLGITIMLEWYGNRATKEEDVAPCPDCGQEIFTAVSSCPHCGSVFDERNCRKPSQASRPVSPFILGIGLSTVGLIVVIAAFCAYSVTRRLDNTKASIAHQEKWLSEGRNRAAESSQKSEAAFKTAQESMGRAKAALSQNDFDEAIRLSGEAQKLCPDSAEIRRQAEILAKNIETLRPWREPYIRAWNGVQKEYAEKKYLPSALYEKMNRLSNGYQVSAFKWYSALNDLKAEVARESMADREAMKNEPLETRRKKIEQGCLRPGDEDFASALKAWDEYMTYGPAAEKAGVPGEKAKIHPLATQACDKLIDQATRLAREGKKDEGSRLLWERGPVYAGCFRPGQPYGDLSKEIETRRSDPVFLK